MGSSEPAPRFMTLAERIRAAAEDLTDEWVDRLGARLGVRPRRLLPTKELRDHVPLVLRGVADFVECPVERLPNETVDILRALTQLRREQGYDVQELLLEFDILSDLVFDRAADWADKLESPLSGREAMCAAAHISRVLRSVASIAVGTYREEEVRQDQELAERLDEFASMIAHEFRGPLNTAGLSAELLSHEEVATDPDQREKYAARIRDRLERINHLVDDVRALAIAEGARSQPHWVPVEEVVDRVFEELQPSAERQEVELRVEAPEEAFDVDAVRVEIALMNLVTNAIKFSDPDKSERWVEVSFGPAQSSGLKGGRRIAVRDNGLGIEEESHNKVFQRFFREHPEVEGTGFGLSIAQRVVEQRGGLLWFESEPGEGTTFFMEIPQRLEASEQDESEVTQ